MSTEGTANDTHSLHHTHGRIRDIRRRWNSGDGMERMMEHKGHYFGWSLMGVLCSCVGFMLAEITEVWIGFTVFCVLFFITYFCERMERIG